MGKISDNMVSVLASELLRCKEEGFNVNVDVRTLVELAGRGLAVPAAATASDMKAWQQDDYEASDAQDGDRAEAPISDAAPQFKRVINEGQSHGIASSGGNQPDAGEYRFGSGLKMLAQRFKSPHPVRANSTPRSKALREERQETFAERFDELSTPKEIMIPNGGSSDESKLRDAERRINVLEKRLQIVKESGDDVIKSLNEEINDLTESSARSEAAMITELSRLDSQRRADRAEFEKRIQQWIVHDKNRKEEVEEYERRISSLLEIVHQMDSESEGSFRGKADREAEEEMLKELTHYVELLRKPTVKRAVNDSFDLLNADPASADDLVRYYQDHPELKEFTLKAELPRMHYEVLLSDRKLVDKDDIREYLKDNLGDETEVLIRAANQSILADPVAIMTCDGAGKLVHDGMFHSTAIAKSCSFRLDLRRPGENRVKVICELAICVPSGDDEEKSSNATLELASANLLIEFSPSPTSTPSGPLVKYQLLDIDITICEFNEGNDARALNTAAAALARDRGNLGKQVNSPDKRQGFRDRFLSKVKQSGIW